MGAEIHTEEAWKSIAMSKKVVKNSSACAWAELPVKCPHGEGKDVQIV